MGEYSNSLGFLLLGVFFNIFLCGVTMFQFSYINTSSFFHSCFQWASLSEHRDPWWITAIAVGLFCLDTFYTVATIHTTWEYCVRYYANPSGFEIALWTYNVTPMCAGISAGVGLLFLGHRAYRLNNQIGTYTITGVLAFGSFVLGIVARAWGVNRQLSLMNVMNTEDNIYRYCGCQSLQQPIS